MGKGREESEVACAEARLVRVARVRVLESILEVDGEVLIGFEVPGVFGCWQVQKYCFDRSLDVRRRIPVDDVVFFSQSNYSKDGCWVL